MPNIERQEKMKEILDRECRMEKGLDEFDRTNCGRYLASYRNCYTCHIHDALAKELSEVE
jgi:hypothetical protein